MTDQKPLPRVLLVDDDVALLSVMESRLAATGRYEVSAVSRGREALQRLSELRPDIIVSDVDMPGIDGGALAAFLRESKAGKGIPILFLSSMISVAESDAGHGHVGNWPMLSKKTAFDKIVMAIDKLLAAPQGGPGEAA